MTRARTRSSSRSLEWARCLGASLLKRMAASWLGPRTSPTEYKVAARGSRALAGSPRIVLLSTPMPRRGEEVGSMRQAAATRDVTNYTGSPCGVRSFADREARTEATFGHDDDACGKAGPISCQSRRWRSKGTLPQPCRPTQPAAALARRCRELLALQEDYQGWLDALPESLADGATAEALRAICDLELSELANTEPPRGFGRD